MKLILFMKKLLFLLVFFSVIFRSHAQDITISFQSKESINTIDSVLATNLRTAKNVSLRGGESLILVKYLTSINSISDNSELGFVYPNPSNTDAIFTFSLEKSQDVGIDLYSNSGQLLSKVMQKLGRGSHRFELKFPEAGIYYLSLIKSDGSASFKTIYTGIKNRTSSISYLGSQKLNSQNSEVNQLKRATTDKEIEYATGDIILYSFFSGRNTTILTDKPTDSRTIDVEFTSCIDPDNKSYKAVKIGSQWWMAENLAYLPKVSPPSLGSDTAAYYYVYDYSGVDVAVAKASTNYNTYGVLYNWPAAKISCPAGWHLPSDDEWKQLELTLGMSQQQADTTGWRGTDQGKQMKSSSGWSTGNGTNTSGFSALPSGYRYSNGNFMHIGGDGCWWSSTDYATNEPWYHFVSRGYSKVHRNHNYNFRKYAWSVRCIKDE
jgi:uncharacterized protein (TIGR02145 family)